MTVRAALYAAIAGAAREALEGVTCVDVDDEPLDKADVIDDVARLACDSIEKEMR